MVSIFAESLIIILVYSTLWFIISVVLKRNDIADIAWGLGFIVLVIYFLLTHRVNFVALTMALMVVIWGLRLSIFILLRNLGKSEDFRYLEWRNQWKRYFYLRSYLQVFLLQSLILLIIISPVLCAIGSDSLTWSWMTFVGVIIWLFGFIYETVADLQLKRFIKVRNNPSEIMQTGLWKFSRHPNYFGEILIWMGIFICVLPLKYGVLLAVSPITITYLLLFVSGVPMLERKYRNHPQYEEYKRNTPPIFPNWR